MYSCRPNQNNQADSQTIAETSESNNSFGIEGEDIALREGAGEQYKKVINEKATQAIGETQYCNVDYSLKVEIIENKGDWSKIRVVEPSHLSMSHVGWLKTKYIIKNESNTDSEKLDTSTFEILLTKHNATVDNFYVLIKFKDFDEKKIRTFISKFRKEYATQNANINLYDSKKIEPLINKYPLEKVEYLEVADHFVALTTFDLPEVVMWYPFQDLQYKYYGGKNWKKGKI